MKKFLSLVLALVMTMSLVTVAGASFTDAADVNYDAAVDVISEMGIVGGYADGSFNPEGTLTRGAAAKIICNILVGPETAASLVANTAPYSDVPANHTFAGYIAYCAEKGIISGYADGTFRPAATLTGYAFVKMLLTGLGYDQAIEGYTGTNWAINVAEDAVEKELTEGLDGKFVGNKAITREEACLYALNALMAKKVAYTDKGTSIVIGGVEITTGAGDAYDTNKALYETAFEKLEKLEGWNVTDEMGRPSVTWKYDGEKVGTYAKAADLVIENGMKEDDFEDLFEDLDVDPSGFTYKDTMHGVTWELFFDENDDGEYVREIVAIYAELVSATYGKDKVSTKNEDERYVEFEFGAKDLKIVADDEVTDGVEVDDFDLIYNAIKDDKDQKFLVVRNEDETEVFSVEIPEVFEAKITRINAKDGVIVADGETYMVYPDYEGELAIGKAELTVGANGVVYAVADVEAEASDVIYVDSCYDVENKWGAKTWYAQIVNEDYEVVEVVVDEEYEDGFYTYEINDDDEYELSIAGSDEDLYEFTGKVEKDDKYVVKGGKKVYFADDMVVVYIDGTEDELEVTVKNGAQNITAASAYILNSDDDIAVLFVGGAYEDGESEDVVYIADLEYTPVADLEGDEAKAYTVYVDGVEDEIMIKNAKLGFWTYEIDEDTGVYELKTQKSAAYTNLKVGTDVTINKDTYVDVKGGIEDVVVSGEIVDLTDEGLNTLAEIDEWDGKDLVVSFLYDTDEEEITLLYVDFVAVEA